METIGAPGASGVLPDLSVVPDLIDRERHAAAIAAKLLCAQEPIHIPGTIQPHGALLAIAPSGDWKIVAASANAAEFLASLQPGRIVAGTAASVLGPRLVGEMQDRLRAGTLRGKSPWQSTFVSDRRQVFNMAVHAHAGLVLVELERAGPQEGVHAQGALFALQEALVDMRDTGDEIEELARVAATGVRRLTGYERVLVYRFDADWNGQALAEDKMADWNNSLRGLRFPAADIPAQARALYQRSPMRWVADRDATPMPLEMAGEGTHRGGPPAAIDLSFTRLRSPSPVHLQIHRNLGINGFMSMSILHDGRLWGLMVCHHRAPHHLFPSQRAAAAALTDAFALRVGPAERTHTDQARRDDLVRLSALLADMAKADVVAAALTTGDITIASLFGANGAALVYDGVVSAVGHTPPETDLRALALWLRTQGGEAKLFQTNKLATAYPPWVRNMAEASGLLAVFLSTDRTDLLMWFRPEEPLLVSWGSGSHMRSPERAATLPRPPFEPWVETRHGFAKPWDAWELDMAETLRHNITEVIVRSLRRIADLHDKLRQSQKMEAVGQLTGGIAHDFNNLLAGILGSMELMQTRLEQGRPNDVARYITAAIASANRAAALVHRLLAFSRRQTLDPKSVDVHQLATSLEDLIRRTMGPAIQVKTAIPNEIWRTLCDANQLENALLNLAINARDAMPDGGRLTIAAANVHLGDDAGGLNDVAAGPYVALSVTDTGIGMSPDVIGHVFEPFFTTKAMGQGTGLGLSMVYGFAKQSDGYATIVSEMGRGTTVRLFLPRHPGGGAPDAVLAGKAEPAAVPACETVLVVDDEPVVRMIVGDVLRDLGHGVIEAADGAEGLRILQSRQRIDLLVSDVGLPGGLNGRQLADAARVYRPELKVLFITGYAEDALLGKGVLNPGTQVLTKPFVLDVLVAKIQAMM